MPVSFCSGTTSAAHHSTRQPPSLVFFSALLPIRLLLRSGKVCGVAMVGTHSVQPEGSLLWPGAEVLHLWEIVSWMWHLVSLSPFSVPFSQITSDLVFGAFVPPTLTLSYLQ